MALWILSAVALVAALVALGTARRASRKLDALNQSYWELRYDYTRLRSRVAQLAPDDEASAPETPQLVPPPRDSAGRGALSEVEGATVSFVPLSAIRRKDR